MSASLMVTDTAFFRNPNYHLPSDTIDTLDFEFMAQLALLELPSVPCPPECRGAHERLWLVELAGKSMEAARLGRS
jgi:hypothetical protein